MHLGKPACADFFEGRGEKTENKLHFLENIRGIGVQPIGEGPGHGLCKGH